MCVLRGGCYRLGVDNVCYFLWMGIMRGLLRNEDVSCLKEWECACNGSLDWDMVCVMGGGVW